MIILDHKHHSYTYMYIHTIDSEKGDDYSYRFLSIREICCHVNSMRK